MKKTVFLTISFLVAFTINLNAQEYHLGQVVTNPDGSQGVVFYLNEDGTDGWMVALHDVGLAIPWGLNDYVPELNPVVTINDDILTTVFSDRDGYTNTLHIREHYESMGYTGQYAAKLVDFENGWYLPAAGQLKMLYVNAIFYEQALQQVGDIMGLNAYWSSTVQSNEKAWYVQFGAPYALNAWAWNGYYSAMNRESSVDHYDRNFAVRAIRNLDFSPLPIIGQLQAPAAICDEGPIELVLPNLHNCDSYGWQIAQDEAFTNPIDYTGQTLDETYNGWYLRLWATNEEGITYSNVIQIAVHHTTEGSESVETCKAYLWNGQSYTATGTYQTTLTNQWGCDSIATLYLTITGPISNEINVAACDHYIWNGIEYNESGDYNQLFQTPGDCDSIVTMHLTVNQPDEYFIPYPTYACGSMEWGDMTLTESGVYQQTFANQHGCDSIVTMSLFVNQNVESQFMDLGCGEYDWNGQIYTESGVYQQTFPAANGCDSIVTLYLTVKALPPVTQILGENYIYYMDNGVYTYSIDPVPGCFGYAWTIDNGWPIVSGADTNECSVNLNFAGTATLTVKVYTECGFIQRTLFINHDVRPNFTIYPNPTRSEFNMVLSGMKGKAVIEIHDYLGQLIDRFSVDTEIDGLTIPYSLQGKSAGIYFISVTNSYRIITKKLVKTAAADTGYGY